MESFERFEQLDLPRSLARNLEAMGFVKPTPIQATAIPPALKGKDIMGIAQTGTGKTAAFGIPMLTSLYDDAKKRALILSPTRELGAQIHQVLRTMSQGMNFGGCLVLGGESFKRQRNELRDQPAYMVATPGRLIDHVKQGLKINSFNILVLDEVDRILDMGFYPQLVEILRHLPKEKQTLMFSATMPPEIRRLADMHLHEPVRCTVGPVEQPVPQITQETIEIPELKKTELLFRHLKEREGKILIFTNTKSRTEWVATVLEKRGFDAVRLHGDCSPNERKAALERFRTGKKRIMVATDLAGRGIDVDDIQHVINFDMPLCKEDYIHRIGRTGRFGKAGTAVNYLCPTDFEGYRILSSLLGDTKPKNGFNRRF